MSEEIEDKDLQNAWSLFAPRSDRGLRVDYPELSDYEEFRALRVAELFFVWLYACKASPLFNSRLKERELVEACIKKANLSFKDPEKRERFVSGDFGEKIESAVKVMYKFEPAVRILAKQIAIKQLADIKKMTSLKLDDDGNHPSFLDKDGNIDMNKKRYYMGMIMDVNKNMDTLVEKAEKGFGVSRRDSKVNDKNLESSGETFAESYHENH